MIPSVFEERWSLLDKKPSRPFKFKPVTKKTIKELKEYAKGRTKSKNLEGCGFNDLLISALDVDVDYQPEKPSLWKRVFRRLGF